MNTICGADCSRCPSVEKCPGCAATCGRPFGGDCVAAEYIKKNGKERYEQFKKDTLAEINALLQRNGIPEAEALYEMSGAYVNLEYPLPSGDRAGLLDGRKIYLASQIEAPGEKRCYGVVADTAFILVSRYGDGGSDPELILYRKRN